MRELTVMEMELISGGGSSDATEVTVTAYPDDLGGGWGGGAPYEVYDGGGWAAGGDGVPIAIDPVNLLFKVADYLHHGRTDAQIAASEDVFMKNGINAFHLQKVGDGFFGHGAEYHDTTTGRIYIDENGNGIIDTQIIVAPDGDGHWMWGSDFNDDGIPETLNCTTDVNGNIIQ